LEKADNCIITIFGASGDLTKRKLMPSLFELYRKNLMPANFAILGIGRSDYNDESFRKKMTTDVKQFIKSELVNQQNLNNFLKHIYYHRMDTNNPANYPQLKQRLTSIDKAVNTTENYIYYLATTPKLYDAITSNLGGQQLNKEGDGNGWKRIIFEKPFGFDLASAKALNAHIRRFFKEEQVYRIDHYLGKETVQNILAFRFANGIFEPLWNRNYIHHVEVTAAESIGVENRGAYYDGAGALRDMVQNHLLQVVATVAMEPPAKFNAKSIRDEKVKIFQSLCPILPENVPHQVVRGQYLESEIQGEKIVAYRDENNVVRDSKTETYIAMRFLIDNWRWGDVPFYVRTGKRLHTRVTEVVIHFKKTPHHLFTREFPIGTEDNQLIIRIQPDEGIMLKFGMKVPGSGYDIRTVDMDFHYKDIGDAELPDAYERLLLDCILGDATLYARADAVEACWEFITPIINAWQNNPNIKLYGYPSGTWGPKEARDLFHNRKEDWNYPSSNLITNGKFYQL
jgi:glucose-6-phosphate 1-dehydrogenase